MYARRLGGREMTFDFREGLIEDNLLMVDRETGSVWSQLAGQAVTGDMRGTPLEAIPSIQTTWAFWKAEHPDTRVAVLPEEGRRYFYQDFVPGTPRTAVAHDASTLGLGLVAADEAWFFPLTELARAPAPQRVEVGGQRVTIDHRPEGMTAWATDEEGRQLTTVLAYERGWRSFYPQSRIYRAPPP